MTITSSHCTRPQDTILNMGCYDMHYIYHLYQNQQVPGNVITFGNVIKKQSVILCRIFLNVASLLRV